MNSTLDANPEVDGNPPLAADPVLDAIRAAIQGAGGPAKVAQEVDVSVQAVCFWRDGKRKFPAEHAPALERMNSGRVRCEQMCPKSDWGYLRGTERA
ncbi:helix-turn-helix domain-containing protein [Variovorax sp. PAMC26660]|uniref:helix-turn-helix domain-containing protein n=1 Tax=Variovorax sp. PAMC26660 TaxID=2762322 RepID=UPI00164DF63B|nr:helix-turn-helix domain-containing protein [Variovorax sp. PAMC26660]QNK68452.1 helix-turn-helix domain-containing protein [Variovorax sp. PAMC26660]